MIKTIVFEIVSTLFSVVAALYTMPFFNNIYLASFGTIVVYLSTKISLKTIGRVLL